VFNANNGTATSGTRRRRRAPSLWWSSRPMP